MSSAYVLTSGKGGVGKSTVAVGLAAQFAAGGERVLLVDCDAGLRSLDRMTGTESTVVYDSSDVVAGRCAPAQAVYPCPTMPGVSLMPAPLCGEDLIPEHAMTRLVPLLKRYFDRVILDSPAGVGRGFRSAAAAADAALVVCSPDPVCIRDAAAVGALLSEMGVEERRLVINRFSPAHFDAVAGGEGPGALRDLDDVIDLSGIRLAGVVPEDRAFAARLLRGELPSAGTPGMAALQRIAARLSGVAVPLAI